MYPSLSAPSFRGGTPSLLRPTGLHFGGRCRPEIWGRAFCYFFRLCPAPFSALRAGARIPLRSHVFGRGPRPPPSIVAGPRAPRSSPPVSPLRSFPPSALLRAPLCSGRAVSRLRRGFFIGCRAPCPETPQAPCGGWAGGLHAAAIGRTGRPNASSLQPPARVGALRRRCGCLGLGCYRLPWRSCARSLKKTAYTTGCPRPTPAAPVFF